MCGHVGVAGDLDRDAMSVFKDLLYMDALRGVHGTGVAVVPFYGDRTPERTDLIKMPVDATAFLRNSAVKSLLTAATHSVVIGHNRYATQGKHVYANTHPFMNEAVVGAHNGTVSETNMDFEVEGKYGTDSETIITSLKENGIKKTFDGMTSGNRGAWALVWYDFDKNEINFVRNSERPFYYAFNKAKDQLFWASEAFMLKAALVRRGVEVDKVYEAKVDTRYCWTVPKHNEMFGEGTRTKCAGKKPKPVAKTKPISQTGWSAHGRRNFSPTAQATNSKLAVLPSSMTPRLSHYPGFDNSNVVQLFGSERNCIWCGTAVDMKDVRSGAAAVVSNGSVVCPKHVDIPVIKEALEEREVNENRINRKVKEAGDA